MSEEKEPRVAFESPESRPLLSSSECCASWSAWEASSGTDTIGLDWRVVRDMSYTRLNSITHSNITSRRGRG